MLIINGDEIYIYMYVYMYVCMYIYYLQASLDKVQYGSKILIMVIWVEILKCINNNYKYNYKKIFFI